MSKLMNLLGPLLFVEAFTLVFVLGLLPQSIQQTAYAALYTVLFFTSALNLDKHRKLMLWLAGTAFVMLWTSTTYSILNTPSKMLNVLFFIVIVGMLIYQISKAKQVHAKVLYQAVNGYLLLGLVYTLLITLVMDYDPNAFSFTFDKGAQASDIIYFGFVTLVTLGYGDLVPLTPLSKSLSLLIAIGGQLYLAVIVAMLVGKFSSRQT